MKMRIIASVIFALILSVGFSTSASARGRYYRPHGHCYHHGYYRAHVVPPVAYAGPPPVVKVVYNGHRGYHGYNHGYRGRPHHRYSHGYRHHYGYGYRR